MTSKDIASVYDKIGHVWAESQMDQRNGLTQHERAVQFCKKRGAAIDIGCGSSGRFIEFLDKQGFAVEGLDISEGMLTLARKKHPRVTFHSADAITWEPSKLYDFITAWDSIWHVPLKDQPGVITKLGQTLAPGGVLIFTSGGRDQADEVTGLCEGELLYHATPGIPALQQIITASGCVLRHMEFDQLPENHLYLIVQRPV